MSGPNRWPAIRALPVWRDRVTLAGYVGGLVKACVAGLLAAEHLAGEGRA